MIKDKEGRPLGEKKIAQLESALSARKALKAEMLRSVDAAMQESPDKHILREFSTTHLAIVRRFIDSFIP